LRGEDTWIGDLEFGVQVVYAGFDFTLLGPTEDGGMLLLHDGLADKPALSSDCRWWADMLLPEDAYAAFRWFVPPAKKAWWLRPEEEAWDLLGCDMDTDGSGGWDCRYVQDFIRANFDVSGEEDEACRPQ